MRYASKGERAKCLWERHEPKKNKTYEGKIIERTFYSREAYVKGWIDDCFHCMDPSTTCCKHQVKIDNEELKRMLASDDEVLIP